LIHKDDVADHAVPVSSAAQWRIAIAVCVWSTSTSLRF
jgi:hypothetical protein